MCSAHEWAGCRSTGYLLLSKEEEGVIAVTMATDDDEAEEEIDRELRQSVHE